MPPSESGGTRFAFHEAGHRLAGSVIRAAPDILDGVEIFFTALLIVVGLLTTWFAVYVVYRLYTD
ncbi:hypothetical protein EV191_103402 [Tamaricihabitans halophyticus]|uniref:Uncharacterized protein n=1 Tax=Tamaricihabitans halophyticus TaxID=1262583 RepID=A0A4R2QXA2_9PSEU|nr:hypothetical protein [Tamaricihabitans halophyticus]TCP54357.1 hypothetical protein EV191_103402 [Tamaricihabitans halophyticus]